MQIPRPTDADRARFEALVPNDERVQVKPMFGNLGAFVNGNMFMGLFGRDIGVKLPDAGRQAVLDVGGGPFGPEGRPMGGYVTLPPSLGAAETEQWVAAALVHVAALPPKKPKR